MILLIRIWTKLGWAILCSTHNINEDQRSLSGIQLADRPVWRTHSRVWYHGKVSWEAGLSWHWPPEHLTKHALATWQFQGSCISYTEPQAPRKDAPGDPGQTLLGFLLPSLEAPECYFRYIL